MHKLATPSTAQYAALLEGEVFLSTEETVVVRTSSGDYKARRAASCMLVPELQDHVLVSVGPSGVWILAVLERRSQHVARLEFDRDLEIRLPQGAFSVNAQKGVTLASAAEVGIAAKGLRVSAAEANLVIRSIRLFAQHCESLLTRLLQRVHFSQRIVVDTEQVKAGRIDYSAEKELTLQGQDASLHADRLIKVDGGQIHIG